VPDINGIPYENAEDLQYYFYDNFLSSESLTYDATFTGSVTAKLAELKLTTGVVQDSLVVLYYDPVIFNPLYSRVVFKLRLDDPKDCFAFIGYKETTAEPTFDMTESHAGWLFKNGRVYVSVADGYHQQRVEVIGIDPVRFMNYQIEYNKFSAQPLPIVEESLSLLTILSVDRTWKLMDTLTNCPPINEAHYLVMSIKNSVNAEKNLYVNRIIYREVYAD